MPLRSITWKSSRTRATVSAWLLVLSPIALLGSAYGARDKTHTDDTAKYSRETAPAIQKYCGACHNPERQVAGLVLTTLADAASLQKDQAKWQKVIVRLRDRTMPPPSSVMPAEQDRQHLIASLVSILN